MGLMPGLATVGFLVNFWAWVLISSLGVTYREELGLTAFQQALLVAVPVVVGRWPHRGGALTARRSRSRSESSEPSALSSSHTCHGHTLDPAAR
jgi:hypothetical protein